jgi:hypothetical protein
MRHLEKVQNGGDDGDDAGGAKRAEKSIFRTILYASQKE